MHTPKYVDNTLPVIFILFNLLPMGDFIPNSTTLNDNECNITQPTRAVSDIVSVQVGVRVKNVYHTVVLGESPIEMNYTFVTTGNISTYHCVFWNFSNP